MRNLERRVRQLERAAGAGAGRRFVVEHLSKAELQRLADLAERHERGEQLDADAREFWADVERRTGITGLEFGAAIRRLEAEV